MSVSYSISVAVVKDVQHTDVVVPLKDAYFNQWKNLIDLEKFYEDYFYPESEVPNAVLSAVKDALSFETFEYKDTYKEDDVANVKYREVKGHTKSGIMKVLEDPKQLEGLTPEDVQIGQDLSGLVDFYESVKKTYKGDFYSQAEIHRNKVKIEEEYKKLFARSIKLKEYVESIDFLKITDEDVKRNITEELDYVSESLSDWEHRLSTIITLEGLLDIYSENGWHQVYLFITNDWNIIECTGGTEKNVD